MSLVLDLLTLPVLGAPRMARWVAAALVAEAERELWDETPIRRELVELQQRLDAGAVDEETYDRLETALLKRLNDVRERARRASRTPGSADL